MNDLLDSIKLALAGEELAGEKQTLLAIQFLVRGQETNEWLRIIDGARADIERCDKALHEILDELGDPSEDYPGPVANAVSIARKALRIEPPGLRKFRTETSR